MDTRGGGGKKEGHLLCLDRTQLHFAAREGHLSAVKALLDAGAASK
jgi:hypothetical protein